MMKINQTKRQVHWVDEGNDLETAEQVSLLGTRFLGVLVRSTAGVVPDSLLCRVLIVSHPFGVLFLLLDRMTSENKCPKL